MTFDENMIKRYAEKIYGFAYSKTGNSHDACDLSQEILLNLCGCDFTDVQCMDSFIYTVCRYTWSKFLRRNKHEWEAVTVSGEIGDFFDPANDGNPEESLVQRETYDRLRREVMYLSGVRRDIIILYYYDRLTCAEIAERLNIPASTVRWHLSKIRSDLKERIVMTDELYKPKKLNIGHFGWYRNEVYTALESDILMQNICIVCREKAKSIEEISRILGVAAVYLEDKIARLLSMDYMVEKNGKYCTNFFIQDAHFKIASCRYEREHVPDVAEAYYQVVKAALPAIRAVGFVGCGLPDNELMWDMLAYFMMREIARTDDRMIQELGLEHGAPMRPDGSRHWVRASENCEDVLASPEMTPEVAEFYKNAAVYGIKCSSNFEGSVRSYQYDMVIFNNRRIFDSYYVTAASKAADLERRGAESDEYDREQLAILANNGYLEITNGHCQLNFPYFTHEEKEKVDRILDQYTDELLDREKVYQSFVGYAAYIDGFIPAYISKNEKAHYKTSFDPHVPVLWYLMNKGLLEKPVNVNAICTVVYEFQE